MSKGKEPREFEGVKGERLKSIKMGGVLSQGLLLPLSKEENGFKYDHPYAALSLHNGNVACVKLNEDVTEMLRILKWERPIPAQLAGQIRGNFPSAVPKTDQERIQNLSKELDELRSHTWQVTEKLHGSSCTFYLDTEGDFHVCSRNLDLKFDENNSYWKAAIKYNIEQKMKTFAQYGVAIQGELIGEGINGNQYKKGLEFYVFDVFNTITQRYLLPSSVTYLTSLLDLNHVPVIHQEFVLQDESVSEILEMADGVSLLNDSQREGLVFKSTSDHTCSFKAVSNNWLIKTGE